MGRKFELGFFNSNGWKKGDHCPGKAIVKESQNLRCSLLFNISKRIRREKEKGLRHKIRGIYILYLQFHELGRKRIPGSGESGVQITAGGESFKEVPQSNLPRFQFRLRLVNEPVGCLGV